MTTSSEDIETLIDTLKRIAEALESLTASLESVTGVDFPSDQGGIAYVRISSPRDNRWR